MSPTRWKSRAVATALLSLVAALGLLLSSEAVKADPSVIATNTTADTSGYTALQKKSLEYVKSAKSIAQFMDRDTRPDFASTVMIPSLQSFLNNPNDVNSLVSSIQKQKVAIFGS